MDEPLEGLKERAWREIAAIDAALDRGDIDQHGWFDAMQNLVTPKYLASSDPRGQSGHRGDAAGWEQARRHVIDAIDSSGDFLDVGCANGLLMQSVHEWAADKGFVIEPYGLDIASELVQLARRRLPYWADRILVGNALHWKPPRRFAFARTGLDYVPARRRGDLLRHLLGYADRVIIGSFNEEVDARILETSVMKMGFNVAGRSECPHRDPRLVRRVSWIDAAAPTIRGQPVSDAFMDVAAASGESPEARMSLSRPESRWKCGSDDHSVVSGPTSVGVATARQALVRQWARR